MIVDYKPYEDEMTRVVSKIRPTMTNSDIRKAILYSMRKRYKQEQCVIDNNYTKTKANNTLLDLANWINEREPICTSYGCMFKKPGKRPNPLIELVRSFMEARDLDKAKMFEYLEARMYELAEQYDLKQILDKRDTNSIYGCLGNSSCLLYNLYVAASITAQGRSSISTAILFFESFLSNNVKFGSLEEVVHFIDCVCSERPNRRYDDRRILNRNISVEECFVKIVTTCGDWRKGKIKWVPDYDDLDIIYKTLVSLDQEDINRIFYKNNLYAFLDNVVIMNGILYILKSLKTPYLSPNEVPTEIKVELDTLQDFFREYVYYPHMYVDRIDRCANMIKNIAVISDTDSAIVCFDQFYKYILNRIQGQDIPITNIEVDMINETINQVPKKELRYDFYNDEIIEKESMIKPFVIIPQNGLRYSIINIIAYICGNLVNEYIVEYTKCNHTWAPDKKCLLYLKNEFLFKRALLTMNKKNYATKQELKEGVILEDNMERSLDIKGLPINKSTINEAAKAELQKILYEEVLATPYINQNRIIERIAILEKQIEQSLRRGEKKFYKPAVIKAMNHYDDPLRIQGIRGAVIWNKVRENLEAIDLSSRNSISIVKVIITPINIEPLKETNQSVYEGFMELFQDIKLFPTNKKKEIRALSIPTEVNIPDWVKDYIDYRTISNDSISNFPFESVGINRLGANNINYSTIMKI